MTSGHGLLLDIGGVVILPNAAVLAKRLRDRGMDVDSEGIHRAFWEANAAALQSDDPVRFWHERRPWGMAWCHSMGIDISHADEVMSAIVDDNTEELWTQLEHSAATTLAELANSGVRIVAVSNATGKTAKSLADAGILDHFVAVLDSAVEGIEKPDRRMYLRALERADVDAAHATFVTDHPSEILGAQNAGIDSVYLYDPFDAMPSMDGCTTIHALSELVGEFT